MLGGFDKDKDKEILWWADWTCCCSADWIRILVDLIDIGLWMHWIRSVGGLDMLLDKDKDSLGIR